MKKGDLVEIVWEDHCSSTPGWRDVEQSYSPSICRTVGYVVAIDRKSVTLTSTYDIDNQMITAYCVRLRKCIIKYKVLKGLK